jgi:hypothetical protein
MTESEKMDERLRAVEKESNTCSVKLAALESLHQELNSRVETMKTQWFKLLIALMGAGGGIGAAVSKWLG